MRESLTVDTVKEIIFNLLYIMWGSFVYVDMYIYRQRYDFFTNFSGC